MRSGRRLGGILGLSRLRDVSSSALGHHFGQFLSLLGAILEVIFDKKVVFFRHLFLHEMSKAFLEDFDGFMMSFS
jgi:hypothetical protein